MERSGNVPSQIDDPGGESRTEPGLYARFTILTAAFAAFLGIKMQKVPLILAPMAGVSDHAFRLVCAEHGAQACVTEMVSANAVCYGDKKTAELARIGTDEAPCALQLFGSDPDTVAEAAVRLIADARADENAAVPVAIDLNMGCPVRKIVSTGQGSALMRTPEKAARMVYTLRERIDLPVTVKLRLGWDDDHRNVVEVARLAEENGAAAVTVHGRTRAQMYRPAADYTMIARVKDALSIPVIGNGDVSSADHALDMLKVTGCDGIMIARGALGNPYIFEEIFAILNGKDYTRPSAEQKLHTALHHLSLLCGLHGQRAVLEFRKHAAWYTKGMRGAPAIRAKLCAVENAEEFAELFALLVAQN